MKLHGITRPLAAIGFLATTLAAAPALSDRAQDDRQIMFETLNGDRGVVTQMGGNPEGVATSMGGTPEGIIGAGIGG